MYYGPNETYDPVTGELQIELEKIISKIEEQYATVPAKKIEIVKAEPKTLDQTKANQKKHMAREEVRTDNLPKSDSSDAGGIAGMIGSRLDDMAQGYLGAGTALAENLANPNSDGHENLGTMIDMGASIAGSMGPAGALVGGLAKIGYSIADNKREEQRARNRKKRKQEKELAELRNSQIAKFGL